MNVLGSFQDFLRQHEHWWPFFYQYGVGLIIFLIGLFIILRYKSCVLSRQNDRFWFGVLIFGFIWYAGIHLVWYLAAINIMPNPDGRLG